MYLVKKTSGCFYSLDLDCPVSLSWSNSPAEPLSLLQPKESAIPPLLLSRAMSLPLGFLHPSMGMLTQDDPAGLCTISRTFCVLHAAGKETCTVPKAAIRAFLPWEGVRFSPARVPDPNLDPPPLLPPLLEPNLHFKDWFSYPSNYWVVIEILF